MKGVLTRQKNKNDFCPAPCADGGAENWPPAIERRGTCYELTWLNRFSRVVSGHEPERARSNRLQGRYQPGGTVLDLARGPRKRSRLAGSGYARAKAGVCRLH